MGGSEERVNNRCLTMKMTINRIMVYTLYFYYIKYWKIKILKYKQKITMYLN